TLWMVLIVVLFSKVLTLVYLMMNEDVLFDRQYSHGAALTVRAYWAARAAPPAGRRVSLALQRHLRPASAERRCRCRASDTRHPAPARAAPPAGRRPRRCAGGPPRASITGPTATSSLGRCRTSWAR